MYASSSEEFGAFFVGCHVIFGARGVDAKASSLCLFEVSGEDLGDSEVEVTSGFAGDASNALVVEATVFGVDPELKSSPTAWVGHVDHFGCGWVDRGECGWRWEFLQFVWKIVFGREFFGFDGDEHFFAELVFVPFVEGVACGPLFVAFFGNGDKDDLGFFGDFDIFGRCDERECGQFLVDFVFAFGFVFVCGGSNGGGAGFGLVGDFHKEFEFGPFGLGHDIDEVGGECFLFGCPIEEVEAATATDEEGKEDPKDEWSFWLGGGHFFLSESIKAIDIDGMGAEFDFSDDDE